MIQHSDFTNPRVSAEYLVLVLWYCGVMVLWYWCYGTVVLWLWEFTRCFFFRQYLPVLRSYPSVYVYEPWLASLDIQKQAGCIIGQDYPAPMCDHQLTLHSNKLQLQQFIISHQERHGEHQHG